MLKYLLWLAQVKANETSWFSQGSAIALPWFSTVHTPQCGPHGLCLSAQDMEMWFRCYVINSLSGNHCIRFADETGSL